MYDIKVPSDRPLQGWRLALGWLVMLIVSWGVFIALGLGVYHLFHKIFR